MLLIQLGKLFVRFFLGDELFLEAELFGLLLEIALRRDAVDLRQITRVEYFSNYEVFDLFLLASFLLIRVDHVEDLHAFALALLRIIFAANMLMIYVFVVELLARGAVRALD